MAWQRKYGLPGLFHAGELEVTGETLHCVDCHATFPRKGHTATRQRCDECRYRRERELERQRYSPEKRHEKHARAVERNRGATVLRMEERRARLTAKREAREATNRGLMDEVLAGGCVDCGELDAIVLQFDHVRGTKTRNVNENMNTDELRVEIAKCDVRCANCHTRRHRSGTANLQRLGG